MKQAQYKIEFLGTGTSTGVPQIGCQCEVCTSTDCRDKRLRSSAIIEANGKRLLIDCGPDFRQQMLTATSWHVDALLITHIHYDHIGGIEDLRAHCVKGPFPIYAKQEVIDDLKKRLAYCFDENPYPGAPQFDTHVITANNPFDVCGIEVVPLPVMHYKLSIVGFRVGQIAYITDAKYIDDKVIESIKGIKLLVINALRKTPHPSHMSLEETLEVIHKIGPEQAYLTHISHQMGLCEHIENELPESVHLACDGLVISI